MDGFRVFLRGQLSIEKTLDALCVLRPAEVLDGPIGQVSIFCLRDNVFVELYRPSGEADGCDRTLARFVGADGSDRAWVAAHAFLWMVTQHAEVDEALLVGSDAGPLHYAAGRIRPIAAPEERRSEDA